MSKETSFYQQVYEVTREIPYGRVSTYGLIANYLSLGSARMVGWALNQSFDMDAPIPAHRVVNRKGELSGRLAFATPSLMEELLKNEGLEIENNKVVNFKKILWDPNKNL